MNGRTIEGIGTVAAVFTTSAWLPQAWKVWGARPLPAESVSFWMYLIISVGIALWVVYGFYKRDRPLIFANVISFAFASSVLVYKIWYG